MINAPLPEFQRPAPRAAVAGRFVFAPETRLESDSPTVTRRWTIRDTLAVNDTEACDPAVFAALRLTMIPGVGPRTHQALLERFENATAVLRASRVELQEVDGVGPKLAAAILDTPSEAEATAEWEHCRRLKVDLLLRHTPAYPRLLEEISDPPSLLYARGKLQESDGLAVAIVGSRRCTLYGRQQAERLAGALARAGVTIVSGLARGIDAAAHQGALAAGGRTLAVLGTGLANIYPPEHQELSVRVAGQGAVLSEMPLGQAPLPGLFPQRNRIISGLSAGVIVIEASRNSGALHTVRHALEQGRQVFAVPGRIDNIASEGCHDIIRDGATLVRGPDDVLEELGPLVAPVRTSPTESVINPRELTLGAQERQILNLIPIDPIQVDEVLRAAGIEPSRVLTTLTILEMKRLVRRLPGGQFCRM